LAASYQSSLSVKIPRRCSEVVVVVVVAADVVVTG
jgi:hypothetical protein